MNTDFVKATLQLPISADGSRPVSAPIEPVRTAASVAISAAATHEAAARSQDAAAAAAEANRHLAENENSSQLTLEFDDQIGRVIYRLVDRQTGQVLRQVPPKEVLAVARALADMRTRGVLLRGSA